MGEFILNLIAVLGIIGAVITAIYRLGPGLSDVMTAWAKRREQGLAHELVDAWAEGYREGQEFERARVGRVE